MPSTPVLPEKKLTDAEVEHITDHFWWDLKHERSLVHARVIDNYDLRQWFLMKLYKTADMYKVRYMPEDGKYESPAAASSM